MSQETVTFSNITLKGQYFSVILNIKFEHLVDSPNANSTKDWFRLKAGAGNEQQVLSHTCFLPVCSTVGHGSQQRS